MIDFDDLEDFLDRFDELPTQRTASPISHKIITYKDDIKFSFHRKRIVVSGELSFFTRAEIQNQIMSYGGIYQNFVTRDTDFIIVPDAEYKEIKKYIDNGYQHIDFDIKFTNKVETGLKLKKQFIPEDIVISTINDDCYENF